MLTVTVNRQAESVLPARGQAGGGKDRGVSGETEREGRGQIETETEETETVEGERQRQGRGEAGLGRRRQSWGWVMEGRGGRMSPSCCQGHTCVMSHFAPRF